MIDIEDVLKQAVLNRKMGISNESVDYRSKGRAAYSYSPNSVHVEDSMIDIFDDRRGFILQHDPSKRIAAAESKGFVSSIAVTSAFMPEVVSGTLDITATGECRLTFVPVDESIIEMLGFLNDGFGREDLEKDFGQNPKYQMVCDKYETGQLKLDDGKVVLWFCPTFVDVIKLANTAGTTSLPLEACKFIVDRDSSMQALRESGWSLYNRVRPIMHLGKKFVDDKRSRWENMLKEPGCGAGNWPGVIKLPPGNKGLGDEVYTIISRHPDYHKRAQFIVITEFGILIPFKTDEDKTGKVTRIGKPTTAMYIPPERVVDELRYSTYGGTDVDVALLYRCVLNLNRKVTLEDMQKTAPGP